MISVTRRGFKSGLVWLLAAVTVAMAPKAASAADKIYMQVPNIPGGSMDRPGWIDVLAFSGNALPPTNAGKSQNNSSACQISVSKQLDISGPRLWAAAITGQTFSTIDIQVVGLGSDLKPFVVYDVSLSNVQITSVADSGSNEIPYESISFKAANLTLTFTPQNNDGTLGTPVSSTFSCN